MKNIISKSKLFKFSCIVTLITFVAVLILCDCLRVKDSLAKSLDLPAPNQLLGLSDKFSYPILKGLKLNQDNFLEFDFYFDNASHLNVESEEIQRLISYFLVALTVPKEDLWVNLSPYEPEKIIAPGLGTTDLGKELLSQDYILKQLSSSMTVPDSDFGKRYWSKPSKDQTFNNLNKIWIVPDDVKLIEYGNAVMISESSLSVKSEKDYFAANQELINDLDASLQKEMLSSISKQVNEGRHFSRLRQIYSALILCRWFKEKMRQSFYAEYIDKNNVTALELEDKDVKNKIYSLYKEAFDKGVYDVIKKELAVVDELSGQKNKIKRRYYSGGFSGTKMSLSTKVANSPLEFKHETFNSLIGDELTRANIAFASSALNKSDETLKEIIKTDRALLRTNDINSLDLRLAKQAKQDGLSYLRLTLRDRKELDSLLTTVHVKDDGTYETRQGLLADIIANGGILLIDYDSSLPQLAEGFNSLYDSNPFYKDIVASKDLKVLGAMSQDNFLSLDTTARSRFKVNDTIGYSSADILDTIGEPDPDFDSIEIETYASPDFEKDLLGQAMLSEEGKLYMQRGKLLEAIQRNELLVSNGHMSKQIVVKGDIWDNKDFQRFIRRLLIDQQYIYNGEVYKLPYHFELFRAKSDYAAGVVNKQIVNHGKENMEDAWVINSQTQDILFSRTVVDQKERLTNRQGLLNSNPELKLVINSTIEDWVWHRIMHSDAEITISVAKDVYIPKVYRDNDYVNLEFASKEKNDNKLNFDEVVSEPFTFIQCSDKSLVRQELYAHLGSDVLIRPITKDTAMNQLFDSINISTDENGKRVFVNNENEILKALRNGETVVLEGIDQNEKLLKDLETVMVTNPYIMVNGERVNLSELSGNLIVTATKANSKKYEVNNFLQLELTNERISHFIKELYPDTYSQKKLDAIYQLKDLFEDLPVAEPAGLYPVKTPLSLSKLSQLFKYGQDIYKAFDEIIISEYEAKPELAAYMRVMARSVFDYKVQNQKDNSINLDRLLNLLSNLGPRDNIEDIYWQVIDSCSPDVVKSILGDEKKFNTTFRNKLRTIIGKSLINHYKGNNKWENYFRHRFGIYGELKDAAVLEEGLPYIKDNWPQRREKALQILHKYGSVFLKGSPGTGKSYITNVLAKELGYSQEDIVGPVTVGVGLHESDIIASKVFTDGKTQLKEASVAKWIPSGNPDKRNGRLFIVDEANLTKEEFWSFLRGFYEYDPAQRYLWIEGERRFFHKDDRIIFTGNQETLTGRKYQDIIQEYMVTVNFDEFDKDFLHERLDRDYLHQNIKNREEAMGLILELHSMFTEVNPDYVFSLRDLQEFAMRVNTFVDFNWTADDIALEAWKQYSGMYSPEERRALENLVYKKFKVDIRNLFNEKISDYVAKNRDRYLEKYDLSLVPSAAEMAIGLESFLEIRNARIAGMSSLQGKRAMVYEGPSGRGKDYVLEAVLKENGYIEAKEASQDTPKEKLVYNINASPDTDEIINTIKKAQSEGAILVIREINLLPSAFLEGQLNDVLTGNAKPGFALFVTMNSDDFGGREAFSTAMQNRVIYSRIEDYTQKELFTIVNDKSISISNKGIKRLVNVHCWIREEVKKVNQRPATRDILNALALVDGNGLSVDDALKQIYGAYYLDGLLKDKSLASDVNFTEKNKVDAIEAVRLTMQFMLPESDEPLSIAWDPVTGSGGYYSEREHLVAFSTNIDQNSIGVTADHEAGHANFTVDFDGLSPVSSEDLFFYLFIWLEDARMEHAQEVLFPYSQVNKISAMEKTFVEAVVAGDVGYLIKLKPSSLFNYILSTYSKGLLNREHIETLSKLLKGAYKVDVVKLALKHIQTAKEIYNSIPEDNSSRLSVELAQYNALVKMQSIKDDFLSVEKLDPKENSFGKSERAQERSVKKAESTLTDMGGMHMPLTEKSLGGLDLERSASLTAKDISNIRKRNLKKYKQKKILALINTSMEWLSYNYGFALMGGAIVLTFSILSLSVAKLLNDFMMLDFGGLVITTLSVLAGGLITYILTSLIGEGYERLNANDGLPNLLQKIINRGFLGKKPVANTHSKDSDIKIVAAQEKKIRSVKSGLISVQMLNRNESFAQLTEQNVSILNDVFGDYYKDTNAVDRSWGSEGNLDIGQFIADPINGFYKSGGVDFKVPKEVFLYKGSVGMKWNPLLEETILFMLNAGFKFSLQVSEFEFVEGIGAGKEEPKIALARLKSLFDKAYKVERNNLSTFLNESKQSEDYILLGARELQEKTEAIYLHKAIKKDIKVNKRKILNETNLNQELRKDEQAGVVNNEFRYDSKQFRALKNKYRKYGSIDIYDDRGGISLMLDKNIPKKDLDEISRIKMLLIPESSKVNNYSFFDDVASLERLIVQKRNFTDLGPIEKLTELNLIHLGGTSISDISSLSSLNKLEDLRLNYTKVSDLRSLKGLSNLKMLALRGTEVSDISPLTNLHKLENLHLEDTQVSDITALANLISINSLSLNSTKVNDIAPLSGLINLEYLDLKNTGVTDISSLSSLRNLADLKVDDKLLSKDEIFKLLQFQNRSELKIYYSSEKYSIASLEYKEWLKRRRREEKQIKMESEYQKKFIQRYLETEGVLGTEPVLLENGTLALDLGLAEIDDLEFLASVTALTVLNLENTKITKLGVLKDLPNLEILHLDKSNLSSLDELFMFMHKWSGLENVTIVYGGKSYDRQSDEYNMWLSKQPTVLDLENVRMVLNSTNDVRATLEKVYEFYGESISGISFVDLLREISGDVDLREESRLAVINYMDVVKNIKGKEIDNSKVSKTVSLNKNVGGIDMSGIEISSSAVVEQPTGAIDLIDFDKLTFTIKSIEKIDSPEKL